MVIRMHFDGKVFIPEQPVDVPVNQSLEFELRKEPEHLPWDPEKADEAWERFISTQAPTGVIIPDEALRRENLYEPPRGL